MKHINKIIIAAAIVLAVLAFASCGEDGGDIELSTASEEVSVTSSESEESSEAQSEAEESKAVEADDRSAAEILDKIFLPTDEKERYGIADVVDQIAPSVVAINISGTAYDYFGREYPTEGSGSGVIISEEGYIVTNEHVISGGKSITVFLHNGESYKAELIGSDDKTDLALLKIDAENLTAAVIGDSSTLRVGDYSIAIGNPLGELQGTVTMGIISALDREVTVDGNVMTMMQSDAAVNPGNSGGGMFDTNGTLIGIVTAKNSESGVEGLGFFIPVNSIKQIISDLMLYGYVRGRPSLGFTTVDITSMYSARVNGVSWIGVYLYEVQKGSNAEEAGLQYKDYISSVNGETITTSDRLYEILESTEVGDTIILEIWRGKTAFDIVLIVEEENNSLTN